MIQTNPLWWLHLRIGGSLRSNLYLVLAYFGIVLFFVTLTYRVGMTGPNPNLGAFYSVWLGIVTTAQAVFVLLLIPGGIKRAVQRDFQLGMIESHRLTPLTDTQVVLGYLFGPAVPSLALFAPGLLMGCYFSAQAAQHAGLGAAITAQVVVGGWLFLMVLLVVAGMMIASIALLSAIAVGEAKFNILGLLIAISVLGGWTAVIFIPGLALLSGVMSGSVLFSAINKGIALGDNFTTITAAVLQTAFTVTFLVATGRKFRRPERPVFTTPLSLVLLGLWGLTLVVGMWHAKPSVFASADFDVTAMHLGASLIVFLAVGLFALHAAAVDRLRFDRAAIFGESHGSAPLLRSLMPLLITVTSLVLLGLLILAHQPDVIAATPPLPAVPPGATTLPATLESLGYGGTGESTTVTFSDVTMMSINEPYMWAAVGLAILIAAWFDYSLFYIAAAYRWKIWVVLLIGWGVLKFGPVFLDQTVAEIYRDLNENPDFEWSLYQYITSLSPIGTLVLTRTPCYPIGIGLAFQLALAIGAAWLARNVHKGLAASLESSATRAASTDFESSEANEPAPSE